MKIALLHLSDTHISGRESFNDVHIKQIASTFYSIDAVDNIIILISGDIAYSGQEIEYNVAKHIIGSIISNIKKNVKFPPQKKIDVFCVPGNHDINQAISPLSNSELQSIYDNNTYDSIIDDEISKLNNYNVLAIFNRCALNDNSTYSLNIDGFTINITLLNSAPFSLKKEEDKGLHYISPKTLKVLESIPDSDFSIAMMHHSPDFLIDSQKTIIDNFIFSKCNVFYYGHEHHSATREVKYEDKESTIFELCGCLSNGADWTNSSFYLNVLDTIDMKYNQKKFVWNPHSSQYECCFDKKHEITHKYEKKYKLSDEFKTELFCDEKNPITSTFMDYYVFPRIKVIKYKENSSREILSFREFNDELHTKKVMTVMGTTSAGKTALLKYCFINYSSQYTVIYCDASKIQRSNCNQIVKGVFQKNYGYEKSDFERFSQTPKDQKMIIIDNIDCLKQDSYELFLKYISENFEFCICSTKHSINSDIKLRIESYFDLSDI